MLKENLYLSSLTYVLVALICIFSAGFDHDIVFYLLVLGLGGMAISLRKVPAELRLEKKDPLIFLAIIILWSGISFIWSIHYVRTLIEFLQLTLAAVVLYISSRLDEEGRGKTISVVGLVSSLIALLGILEYIFVKTGRITSTFVNPNPFGTYLLILFLFYWGYSLREKKLFLNIISVVYLVALFLTGSRGAYLSLIVAIPFLFIGLSKSGIKKSFLKSVLIFSGSLAITWLVMYIAPIVQESLGLDISLLDSLLRSGSLENSSTGRFEFWKTAIRIFAERPLTGFGLGTFFQSYFIGYGGNQWYSRFAHNHYLQILAELGIVGLILFLAFILSSLLAFWRIYRSREYPPYFIGIAAAFIGFLAHIFIEFSWNFPGVTVTMFWLLGMGLSLYKREGKQIKVKTVYLKITVITVLMLTLWHFGSMKAYSLGFKYEDSGDTDKALRTYHTINSIYPINHNGFLFESNIYISRFNEEGDPEDLAKGIELAEKAVKLAPMDGKTHTHIAQLYRTAGDMEKAEEHYLLGKKYAAYVITRYRELAQFYLSQGRTDEAETVLLEAAELSEYAVMAALEVDKQSRVFDASSLHVLLFDIYKNRNDIVNMKAQAEIIFEMADKYEFLKDWYKMEMFEIK